MVAVTVKVRVGHYWGSGVLVQRRGDQYAVLTNRHVLEVDDSSYQIETADGKLHGAQRFAGVDFGDRDLGVLTFTSHNVACATASIGQSDSFFFC